MQLYGPQTLTRKERAKLRQRGILPTKKKVVQIIEENNQEFPANEEQPSNAKIKKSPSRQKELEPVKEV